MNSTIKMEPKLSWPELGNDTGKPQEADDFIRAFEAICNLANNGQGMKPMERVVTIGKLTMDEVNHISGQVHEQVYTRLTSYDMLEEKVAALALLTICAGI